MEPIIEVEEDEVSFDKGKKKDESIELKPLRASERKYINLRNSHD
jgi:hypothetical protein